MAEEDEQGTLTTGWCQKIVSGVKGQKESYLQVLDMDSNSPMIKLTLSDGKICMEAVVSTQAKNQCDALQRGSIIQADPDDYTLKIAGGKRTAMFVKINIIQPECELLDGANKNAPAPHYGLTKINQDVGAAPTRAAPSPLFGNNRSKPKKQSPFMSNPAKKRIQGADGNGFSPIANLNPYTGQWTIKGRCTEKGEMRTWENARGSGKLFNFTLLDATGDIRITAFKDEADKHFATVVEGEVYTLQKGRVKFDTYQKKNAITMTRDSKLELCRGDKDTFIKVQYDFKNFKEIMDMDVLDNGPKKRVDTCCIITSVGDRQEFTAKNDKTYVKRDIICADETGIAMSVTFWGTQADEYTEDSTKLGTVLILPQASVSSFGGRTLSAQKVVKNIDEYPEAVALREWWLNGGKDGEFQQVKATLVRTRDYTNFQTAKRLGKGTVPQGITDEEVKNHRGDYITVSGVINMIRISQDRYPWYKSEPEGLKKVEQMGEGSGNWTNKDGVEFPEYNCRWLLRFKFADCTMSEWVSGFDEVGNAVMATTAKEMEAVAESDFETAEKYFRERQFGEWTTTIQCKQEYYQDKMQMRYRVVQIEELNYVKESKRLIDELKTWT